MSDQIARSVVIPFTPRIPQKLILAKLQSHRFVTAICHRRLGKTLLGVFWLIGQALASEKENFRGYYFGSTQKAAKQVAWHYFKQLLAPLSQEDKVIFRETELQVVFVDNGAVITLAGSENIESYRGIYIDSIVADEVASWTKAQYAWFEVLRPAMADRLANGLVIGTVKGLNLLYEFYLRGISTADVDKEWTSVKLPASVTNILKKSELRELKHSMSEEAFERELECNFFAESPDVLITPQEARQAQTRTLEPDEQHISNQAQKVFGCDIGRGGDPTVVYLRQGLRSERIFKEHDTDNMSVAAKISRLIRMYKPQTVFIDSGQGQGVIDRLLQLGHQDAVVEIHFNDISPEKACVNMRAAMYYRVKKFLSRGVIPDDPELLKELVNQELVEEPNNRIKLAPKLAIRARILRSPNDSDALALCFADESVEDIVDPEQIRQHALTAYLEHSGVEYRNPAEDYNCLTYMEQFDTLTGEIGENQERY